MRGSCDGSATEARDRPLPAMRRPAGVRCRLGLSDPDPASLSTDERRPVVTLGLASRRRLLACACYITLDPTHCQENQVTQVHGEYKIAGLRHVSNHRFAQWPPLLEHVKVGPGLAEFHSHTVRQWHIAVDPV